MRVVLDASGRLIIPKVFRQALGLKPGQALEICAVDGRLEIAVAPTPMRLKKSGKRLVPVLTSEQVRDTLERIRRRRAPSTRLFESTHNKLGDESDLFRDLER